MGEDDGRQDHETDPDGSDEDGDEASVALDVLEAEEIQLVEANESATILVDEKFEIVAIRREEVTFEAAAQSRRGDEFVCRSCFLLLKNVQLADQENTLCVDCT